MTRLRSSNPFVSIRFPLEGEEYAVCPTAGCGEENDNPDAEFEDSHARVDITAITLNGRAAMSMLSRVDAGQFALIASGLELGKHEVEYMAVDDAGNVATFEFAFSVVERTPYELSVSPGWNLISFPGTPSDPSLGGVIPSGGLVSPVLAYQNGDWLTAVENEEGEWLGNLTQFEAGFGYWLFTTTFTTLEPLIEEPDQTSVLPSVRVDHGWNLLGVIDIFQNPAGTPPGPEGGDGEADDYFTSIPWRIAYTYETLYSLWVKAVPDADRLAPEDTTADESRVPPGGWQGRNAGDPERQGLLGLVGGAGHAGAVGGRWGTVNLVIPAEALRIQAQPTGSRRGGTGVEERHPISS